MCSIQQVSESKRIFDLQASEVTIGRGPFLGVTDKRVSRSHGTLKRVNDGVEIKSIHINPCFYARKANPEKWLKLEKNESTVLHNGDIFSLLPKHHIYRVVNPEKEVENDEICQKTTKIVSPDKAGTGTPQEVKSVKLSDFGEKINSQTETIEEKQKNFGFSAKNFVSCRKTPTHGEADDPEEIESVKLSDNGAKMNSQTEDDEEKQPNNGDNGEKVAIKKILPFRKPQTRISSSRETFMDGDKEIAFPTEKKRKLPSWMTNSAKTQTSNADTPTKAPKKTTRKPHLTPKTSTAKQTPKIHPMKFESDESEEEITPHKKSSARKTRQQKIPEASISSSDNDDVSNNDKLSMRKTRQRKVPEPTIAASDDDIEVPDVDVSSECVEMVDASVNAVNDASSARAETGGHTVDESSARKGEELTSSQDRQNEEGSSQNSNEDVAIASGSQPTSHRTPCEYGSSCYRKNPLHSQQFSHPGDADYIDSGGSDDDDNKPECPYGTGCYRKNPIHKKKYSHTRRVAPKRVAKMRADRKKRGDESSSDDYDLDDSFLNDDESEEDVDEGASEDEDSDWNPSQNSQNKKTRRSPRSRKRKATSYKESDSDATTDDEDLDDLVADAKKFATNRRMWKK